MDPGLCGRPGMACVAKGVLAPSCTSDKREPASLRPARAVHTHSFSRTPARVGLWCPGVERCAPL